MHLDTESVEALMLKRFLVDESGTTAIEYALMVSLIAVAIIGSVSSIGNSSTVQLETIAQQF
jgi:pilus assembly protein Flp/PilA